jgi:hypothetical protein
MKNIAAAFVKAQKEFAPALKTNTNPAFKSKYVSLDGCIEAVIDALNSNGIALMQPTHLDDKGVTVETMFLHESGEVLSGGKLHVPAAKQDPQGFGSALTYARRYSLMSACGIAPEDDDGNAGSKRAEDKTKKEDSKKMPENMVVDWLAYVNSAASMRELKSYGGEAEAATADYPEALARIRSAVANKTESAKRAKETV